MGLRVTGSGAQSLHVLTGGRLGRVDGGDAPRVLATLVAGIACFLFTVSFRLRVDVWVCEWVGNELSRIKMLGLQSGVINERGKGGFCVCVNIFV